ncbi:hypothetical protein AYI70_g2160 [Smittium culicis]|uniref:Uncharacterized protein n=1 Tax=Smittium culicis TaxID=133412 RepID=A0A1R1Y9L5_9FUNG|nr:hypothetical protein AYI70_g11975 [Smittium culicis]OMJ10464.1 hypothetical protein AYI70_g10316 [Smittium culicis]OMJ23612.1 hypothetical protein AYI70_g2160 [Smittium culicis]
MVNSSKVKTALLVAVSSSAVFSVTGQITGIDQLINSASASFGQFQEDASQFISSLSASQPQEFSRFVDALGSSAPAPPSFFNPENISSFFAAIPSDVAAFGASAVSSAAPSTTSISDGAIIQDENGSSVAVVFNTQTFVQPVVQIADVSSTGSDAGASSTDVIMTTINEIPGSNSTSTVTPSTTSTLFVTGTDVTEGISTLPTLIVSGTQTISTQTDSSDDSDSSSSSSSSSSFSTRNSSNNTASIDFSLTDSFSAGSRSVSALKSTLLFVVAVPMIAYIL